jgi:hypothetical protein
MLLNPCLVWFNTTGTVGGKRNTAIRQDFDRGKLIMQNEWLVDIELSVRPPLRFFYSRAAVTDSIQPSRSPPTMVELIRSNRWFL